MTREVLSTQATSGRAKVADWPTQYYPMQLNGAPPAWGQLHGEPLPYGSVGGWCSFAGDGCGRWGYDDPGAAVHAPWFQGMVSGEVDFSRWALCVVYFMANQTCLLQIIGLWDSFAVCFGSLTF